MKNAFAIVCLAAACQFALAQTSTDAAPPEPTPPMPAPSDAELGRPDPASSPTEAVGGANAAAPQEANIASTLPSASSPQGQALPQVPHDFSGAKPAQVNVSSPAFTVHMGSLAPARVVAGAPYCADAESESVTRSSDGKHVTTQTVVTRLCRDAQGRTRQELSRDGRPMVFITDPLQKTRWMLDFATKTASALPVGGNANNTGTTLLMPTALMPTPLLGLANLGTSRPGSAVGIGQSPSGAWTSTKVFYGSSTNTAPPGLESSASAEQTQRLAQWAREVALQLRTRLGSGEAIATANAMASPMASAVEPSPALRVAIDFANTPRGDGVVTSLGQREIDGIRANGELTTWLVEPSKGNALIEPIRITREVWTSPDLMLTLLSKDLDPRRGDHHYRLKNINRSIPDPELFKVPADYSVRPLASK